MLLLLMVPLFLLLALTYLSHFAYLAQQVLLICVLLPYVLFSLVVVVVVLLVAFVLLWFGCGHCCCSCWSYCCLQYLQLFLFFVMFYYGPIPKILIMLLPQLLPSRMSFFMWPDLVAGPCLTLHPFPKDRGSDKTPRGGINGAVDTGATGAPCFVSPHGRPKELAP